MRIFFLLFGPLFLVGCTVFAQTSTVTSFPQALSDDFEFEYYWETGSLPPPYFYSYTISVGPGAQGEIEFRADYSDEEPPIWIEIVAISEKDLDQLYRMFYDMGIFEKEWLQAADTPAGGSTSKLSGYVYGQVFSIPSFVAGDQQARDARALYEHIEGLVSQETWDKLMALHDEYVAENEDE